MNRLTYFLLIISILGNIHAQAASDTLKVTIQQADSLFLAKSYYLLAASMNIEAQKAQIIQAKLYPNPVFTADLNAYDPDNNKVFHVGQTGQKVFMVEQLIVLGGKRKSEIEMAKTNAAIAELEFQQLIRQLKFKLHSDLFALGQQKKLLNKYNSQLTLLDTILSAYSIQAAKGNIPLKDVVRLKGVYLKLTNDRAEIYKQYYEHQANIQILLQQSEIIDFQFSEETISNYIKIKSFEELKDEAMVHRTDLLIAQQNKVLSQQYLQYQKRMAIPDINFFSSYDQRGGAFNNQINAGISVPLPLWSRNQGNIKTAQYKLKETEYELESMQTEILNSLYNHWNFYNQTVSEYKNASTLYNQDFEITVKGMTDNFQKRNISIIEFVDFFEAYNEVLTALTRIKTQLVVSGEQLNLIIGKEIY